MTSPIFWPLSSRWELTWASLRDETPLKKWWTGMSGLAESRTGRWQTSHTEWTRRKSSRRSLSSQQRPGHVDSGLWLWWGPSCCWPERGGRSAPSPGTPGEERSPIRVLNVRDHLNIICYIKTINFPVHYVTDESLMEPSLTLYWRPASISWLVAVMLESFSWSSMFNITSQGSWM